MGKNIPTAKNALFAIGNKTEVNSNGKIGGLIVKIKNYELGKNLGTSGVLDQK